VALVDSGATENFMSLGYVKWLRLPIKHLARPRPLFNVDGTENKSGVLHFYTDLQMQMGGQRTNHRFFLSNLGEHKAILGYPWFANTQPRIDWKKGWIDISHLPIVLSAPDTMKARYVPRTRNIPQPLPTSTDQYYIRKVAINPPDETTSEAIPEEYKRHGKVFSKMSSQ
jgi:hypothetical protein